MKKIKELVWFARFCSFSQYTRERKIGVYLLANLFNAIIPLTLLALWSQRWIGATVCLFANFAVRVMFAPFDNYTSEDYSFQALSRYPLKLSEKLFLRNMVKLFQISEWFYALIIFVMAKSLFDSNVLAVIFTVLLMIGTWLWEEALFFLLYLLRKAKNWKLLYEIFWIAISVLIYRYEEHLVFENTMMFELLAAGILLALFSSILLGKYQDAIHIYSDQKVNAKRKIPFSSQFLGYFAGKSLLARNVALDLIILLKMRVWDLISALGYVVMFSILSKDENAAYMMVQFFIVDYTFLVGFNFFGNNDTREGLFLFGTVDKKIPLKAFHISLMIVSAFFSTIITIVLGLMHGITLKEFVLYFTANLFCIVLTTLISSVLSIRHYHTEYMKKKYSAGNIVIMLLVIVFCSVLAALLLAGNILSAIALVFMVLTSLVGLFLLLGDVNWIQGYFEKNLSKIVKLRQSTF